MYLFFFFFSVGRSPSCRPGSSRNGPKFNFARKWQHHKNQCHSTFILLLLFCCCCISSILLLCSALLHGQIKFYENLTNFPLFCKKLFNCCSGQEIRESHNMWRAVVFLSRVTSKLKFLAHSGRRDDYPSPRKTQIYLLIYLWGRKALAL